MNEEMFEGQRKAKVDKRAKSDVQKARSKSGAIEKSQPKLVPCCMRGYPVPEIKGEIMI
jgi:hypothetical protein